MRSYLAALLVVVGLVSSACGTYALRKNDLAETAWVVVSMTGFPDDNIVEGAFDFTNERFRYYDGVNHSSRLIEWTDNGFAITGGGTSTDARSRYGDRYLSSFAEIGSEIDITRNADGTITLTRDNLVITAEPA